MGPTGGGLHGVNARADPLALPLRGERDRQSGDCRLGCMATSETRSHQRFSDSMPRKSAPTNGFRLVACCKWSKTVRDSGAKAD